MHRGSHNSHSSEKMTAVENALKESSLQIDQLNEQIEKETQSYEHIIERQKVKHTHEQQSLSKAIELLKRDRHEAFQKVSELDEVLDKQRHLFETKIHSLKDRVNNYKIQSLDLRYLLHNGRKMLEGEHMKSKMHHDELHKKQTAFLNFLATEITSS